MIKDTKQLVRQSIVSRANRKLNNKVSAYVRKVRILFNIPIDYHYKDFSISLPANHMLPIYQANHPKYDRFLPHLAKYIKHSETIIDIGANVGDTLAGMVELNSKPNYICIEPDDLFFEHLQSNITRIKSVRTNLAVDTIKSLVGKSISDVTLEGHGGTKHAVISNEGSIKSEPLDKLLAKVSYRNFRLLKTDVDGFDYDVIDSSTSLIREHGPIIFFECQYDYDYQKLGYERMLHSLQSEGYSDWTVFDNYGEVIIRTSDLDVVVQLMHYVWNQNVGCATRTIYYFDILAVQKADTELIDRVLAEYH
jgi:FkbM family methyltransferase